MLREELGYIYGPVAGVVDQYVRRDLGWQRMGRESWRDGDDRLVKLIRGTLDLKLAPAGTRVYFPECAESAHHHELYEYCQLHDLELHPV